MTETGAAAGAAAGDITGEEPDPVRTQAAAPAAALHIFQTAGAL